MYGYAPVKAKVLAVRVIPNINPYMKKEFALSAEQWSIGMLTLTIDDVGYTAVDEATKKARVQVVYARSFYAGSSHASGPLSGEFIGILAGSDPAEVESGLNAAIHCAENTAFFYTADPVGEPVFYAQCISRTGTYLSSMNNIAEGEPISYLIAPPLEAMYGLDAAVKAANVKMVRFYGPPSETNFGGGLLTGTQADCEAACDAFASAVMEVASHPRPF